MIKKIPHQEINTIPSNLNTSSPTGVASMLANQAAKEPQYNGLTIDDMRGNPLFDRVAEIDKIGLAQKKLAETGEILSKSKFVREANRRMQHLSKPKK